MISRQSDRPNQTRDSYLARCLGGRPSTGQIPSSCRRPSLSLPDPRLHVCRGSQGSRSPTLLHTRVLILCVSYPSCMVFDINLAITASFIGAHRPVLSIGRFSLCAWASLDHGGAVEWMQMSGFKMTRAVILCLSVVYAVCIRWESRIASKTKSSYDFATGSLRNVAM